MRFCMKRGWNPLVALVSLNVVQQSFSKGLFKNTLFLSQHRVYIPF
uniref:Uncharacterized protein n=1 Tax=virus sp. ct9pU4 TaxID=2828248 RepID=A0A8S5RBW0_9VIRU|nr:MAG TPA: hypothetical protein [virus sp. ct9pU4]